MKEISKQRKDFCFHAIITFNEKNNTQAAIKAGYSAKTARKQASYLKSRPDIKKEMTRLKDEVAEEAERLGLKLSPKRILQEEACIAHSNIVGGLFDDDGNQIPPWELSEELQRAIASFEIIEEPSGRKTYKYKLHGKGQSLKRIEQMTGMMKDEEKTQPITVNLVTKFEKNGDVFKIPKEE